MNANEIPQDWQEIIVARAIPHVEAGMPMEQAIETAMVEHTAFLQRTVKKLARGEGKQFMRNWAATIYRDIRGE